MALFLSQGCSRVGQEQNVQEKCSLPMEPTIASIHSNLFRGSCAFVRSCHIPADNAGRLVLACAVDNDGDRRADEITSSKRSQQAACWNLVDRDAWNPNEAEGQKRLVRGDPDASFLLRKLEGAKLAEGEAENCPMPWNTGCDASDTLEACIVDVIKQWVADGATDCEDPPPEVAEMDWEEFCADEAP